MHDRAIKMGWRMLGARGCAAAWTLVVALAVVGCQKQEDREAAAVPEAASDAAVARMEVGQREAEAALASSSGDYRPGPVTERPDFVSRLEWQALQGVAAQHEDPARELTRLVNNLRFSKQLEQWRQSAASWGTSQRQVLAGELLQELPDHVGDEAIGVDEARRLQEELLGMLEPDPQQRVRRLGEEADRLGGMRLLQPGDGQKQP